MKNLLASAAIALLSAVTLSSCELEEFPAKALPPFNAVQSNGGVTFHLISGEDNQVISTSMMESSYSVSGGVLSVNSAGGSMTITVKTLKSFSCNACSVDNPYPLVADTLNMSIHAGSADLQNIHINGYLGLRATNLGKYKFTGYASFFDFSSVNLVTVEAANLQTDSVYVNSTSVVDAKVRASHVVNVFINSVGGVRYWGNPPIVRLSRTGMGTLVRED